TTDQPEHGRAGRGASAGAAAHDIAGELDAEDRRLAGRRRKLALALQHVGVVERGRADADEELPGPRYGGRDLPDREHGGPTRLLGHDGAHGCHFLAGTNSCTAAANPRMSSGVRSARSMIRRPASPFLTIGKNTAEV